MRLSFSICLSFGLFVLGATPPTAQTTVPPSTSATVQTAHDARGIEGVGRLDIRGADGASGFCTAALVSPSLVLTAAHCLFDKSTGQAFSNEAMTFRAGLRQGEETASRRVRRMVIHPGYTYSERPTGTALRTDLALLELARDVRLPQVHPFAAQGSLTTGDAVELISYARGRADAPMRESGCTVLDRDARVLVLSCSVDYGASGSPVFVRTAQGLQIVSVISSMSDWDGRPVALAVTVESGLEELKREFLRTPQFAARRKVLRVGEDGGTGTIRFHRPGD
ncbi:V8-like Glu-specific endopeptidase [Jannaschia donghaensis]|uniref:V8-like Glu-specific endopeptidase n=2 Tax=Jannaschia donghaensis TaxID=420998 RepID=A0A0M6YFP9_9RHOB|nr:V8-like Glu-specific endopeptidase [Jannaschia donghaensis]